MSVGIEGIDVGIIVGFWVEGVFVLGDTVGFVVRGAFVGVLTGVDVGLEGRKVIVGESVVGVWLGLIVGV
jgi:hypothetical protein